LNIKTIGCESDCDLTLHHASVSSLHARLELRDNGHIYVLDAGSEKKSFLNRNDQWIRVHKTRLCVADRIRFGELEVPLPQLVAVFGKGADVRLGDKQFSLRKRNSQHSDGTHKPGNSAPLERPKRNPLTGKIEQQTAKQAIEIPIEQTTQQDQNKDG
jgi:hypothetical protein